MALGRRILAWHCPHAHSSLLGVALLTAFSLGGQDPIAKAKRTFSLEPDVKTFAVWRYIPRWNSAILVGYDTNFSSGLILYTIDRDGRREEMMFTLQDGARINAYNIAASPKGEIAIVGSALTANIQDRTFVARIAADRTQQVITRTWPYCPKVVTFAPDGSLWTIGNLKSKEGIGDIPGHYLRRFDPSGKMLASTTVRARGWHSDEISFLSASRDRVGWFTTDGEYIEFSLDGSEIARYDGPDGENARDITGVALSEENDVVAGHFGKGKAQFVALDRETHRWLPAALPAGYAPTWAWVLGFDGTTMVTYSEMGILHRLRMD